jgi:hypothetical protein
MTAQEIMDKAKTLYANAQSVMSVSGARQAAMTAAALLYNLAALQLDDESRKKLAMDDDAPAIPEWEDDLGFVARKGMEAATDMRGSGATGGRTSSPQPSEKKQSNGDEKK